MIKSTSQKFLVIDINNNLHTTIRASYVSVRHYYINKNKFINNINNFKPASTLLETPDNNNYYILITLRQITRDV